MRKFFVGQRVRVVACSCPIHHDEVIDREGVVNELDCISELDDFGLIRVTVNGDPEFCFMEEEFEPILPEGSAPSEFTFQQLMDELKRIEA